MNIEYIYHCSLNKETNRTKQPDHTVKSQWNSHEEKQSCRHLQVRAGLVTTPGDRQRKNETTQADITQYTIQRQLRNLTVLTGSQTRMQIYRNDGDTDWYRCRKTDEQTSTAADIEEQSDGGKKREAALFPVVMEKALQISWLTHCVLGQRFGTEPR